MFYCAKSYKDYTQPEDLGPAELGKEISFAKYLAI